MCKAPVARGACEGGWRVEGGGGGVEGGWRRGGQPGPAPQRGASAAARSCGGGPARRAGPAGPAAPPLDERRAPRNPSHTTPWPAPLCRHHGRRRPHHPGGRAPRRYPCCGRRAVADGERREGGAASARRRGAEGPWGRPFGARPRGQKPPQSAALARARRAASAAPFAAAAGRAGIAGARRAPAARGTPLRPAPARPGRRVMRPHPLAGGEGSPALCPLCARGAAGGRAARRPPAPERAPQLVGLLPRAADGAPPGRPEAGTARRGRASSARCRTWTASTPPVPHLAPGRRPLQVGRPAPVDAHRHLLDVYP